MKFLKLTGIILSLAFILNSCSKTANQGKMVPKEAGFVLVINMKSLTSKVSWNDLKETSWFKDKSVDSNMTEWKKKMLANPETSGIDMKSDLVFFLLKKGEQGQAVFVGDVKDSKAFQEFNKRFDSTAVPTKEGDLNFLKFQNKALMGWNDTKFVYVADVPMKTPSMNMLTDSTQDSTKQMAPVGSA